MAQTQDNYKLVPNADDVSMGGSRYSSSTNIASKSGIPRIPLDLREHKRPIAIAFTILIMTGGVLPILLYYVIKDVAHASNTIAITVSTVIFGANSIFSGGMRLFKLLRKTSTVRPIGATKRHLDYFMIVFLAIFTVLTPLISAGSALAGSEVESTRKMALRIVSMGLPLVMIMTCTQLIAVFVIMTVAPSTTLPFRLSSLSKGSKVRPAVYTITEDVVAVDGKQGVQYRRELNERYQFSKDIRALFKWADATWGFSGMIIGVGLLVVIWVVSDPNIGFILSFSVPWGWGSLFALLTIKRTQAALRKENKRYPSF